MIKEPNDRILDVFFLNQKQELEKHEKFYSGFCLIVFVVGSFLLASCGKKGKTTSLPTVDKSYGVITMAPRKTVILSDFPATIQGQQNVEIRPKIDSYMQSLYIDEGSVV